MQMLLSKHKRYPWKHYKNVYYRGESFYKNKLYRSDDFGCLLSTWNEGNVKENIGLCNGNFIAIITFDESVYVFADKIMSFPILWREKDGDVVITDDVSKICDRQGVFRRGVRELLAFGYVLGNDTIYKNIYSIRGGECLKIQGNTINKSVYYQHLHNESFGISTDEWLVELNRVVISVFDRFVKRLNGRQVVLFLSGGYDSRLILLNLVKRNYTNLICVSLCASRDKDVIVARQISESLGVKLLTFNFSKKYWRKLSLDDKFWDFLELSMNGFCLHYLQGMIVNDLVEQGKVEKNCVVVTGNSGDVVEGEDICENFYFDHIYSKQDVVEEIINAHGVNIVNNSNIRKEISEHIYSLLPGKNEMSFSDAQDVFEYFNWIERQCKYVTSDVRNYDDFIGVDWLLPLWDDEFVKFWLKVPIKLRYKRKLYYMYVKNDALPTANVLSLFLRMRRWLDKHFPISIKIFYPFRQILMYSTGNITHSYCGVVNIFEYIYLQYKTLGDKNKFITSVLYKFFKRKYNKNIFSIIKNES